MIHTFHIYIYIYLYIYIYIYYITRAQQSLWQAFLRSWFWWMFSVSRAWSIFGLAVFPSGCSCTARLLIEFYLGSLMRLRVTGSLRYVSASSANTSWRSSPCESERRNSVWWVVTPSTWTVLTSRFSFKGLFEKEEYFWIRDHLFLLVLIDLCYLFVKLHCFLSFATTRKPKKNRYSKS